MCHLAYADCPRQGQQPESKQHAHVGLAPGRGGQVVSPLWSLMLCTCRRALPHSSTPASVAMALLSSTYLEPHVVHMQEGAATQQRVCERHHGVGPAAWDKG